MLSLNPILYEIDEGKGGVRVHVRVSTGVNKRMRVHVSMDV